MTIDHPDTLGANPITDLPFVKQLRDRAERLVSTPTTTMTRARGRFPEPTIDDTIEGRSAALIEALHGALREALPLVEKWCHYQGNDPQFREETLAPIRAALALAERE